MSEASEKPDLKALSQQKRSSIVGELVAFLLENKKWWLVPVLLALGLVGLLVFAGGSGAAPFIYTVF